jgi:hypothetical protein
MSHGGLKFVVPDVESTNMNSTRTVVFVIQAAGVALQIANLVAGGAVLASAAGFAGLAVTGPLAAAAGLYVSLGAGYAAGRKIAAERAMVKGYSRGVVMGIHGRTPRKLMEYFGNEPFFNTFDQDSAILARKAYVAGLVAGYVEGSKLSPGQKHTLLKDLEYRGGLHWGQLQHDSDREAMFWYVEMAATFQKAHIAG